MCDGSKLQIWVLAHWFVQTWQLLRVKKKNLHLMSLFQVAVSWYSGWANVMDQRARFVAFTFFPPVDRRLNYSCELSEQRLRWHLCRTCVLNRNMNVNKRHTCLVRIVELLGKMASFNYSQSKLMNNKQSAFFLNWKIEMLKLTSATYTNWSQKTDPVLTIIRVSSTAQYDTKKKVQLPNLKFYKI